MASISDQSEDKWLLARVEDCVKRCLTKTTACFVGGFLDERQAAVVAAWLKRNAGGVSWRLWGGHDHAERVVLGIFSDDLPLGTVEFPVAAIGFLFRHETAITHRDVLGSLIGCGITRDKIGDILCTSGLAVAFVRRELAAFVADTVTKIGREGVTVQCPYSGEMPTAHTFKDVSGTLASVRLDAVVKVLLGVSREQAADLIRKACVSINHQVCQSLSTAPNEGDTISVKGKGRFVIDTLSDTTAKGRLVLKARKYI